MHLVDVARRPGCILAMIQVDPPDYPPWPTARRLTPLWWGQRTLVLLALFCAFIYVGLSLGIPILIQRAIDNAIVPGNPSDVWPYVIAIMVLAVIRFWINFTRRVSIPALRAANSLSPVA